MTTEHLLILLAFIIALAFIGEVYLARQRHRNPPPSHPFMEPDEVEELRRQIALARKRKKSTAPYFARLRQATHQALRKEVRQ